LRELSKAVLPYVQLQVHYRSRSREPIIYSNEAFYAGALNTPVRHPEAEVDKLKPIEMIDVGGLYSARTNEEEARQVVARLEEMWLANAEPPTTGVVTFNSNQADLIEELLEERAKESAAFARVYRREATREVGGEDVGFFVKNVENVQDDESDHILFSTTFGRNEQGTFRRYFGVLGQSGGERRLNVAVTRAKARITIFTSMPIPKIAGVLEEGGRPATPRDYLQLYLAYADALSRSDYARAQQILEQLGTGRNEGRRKRAAADALDAFERSVACAIEVLGWTPAPARDGGAFGIDLAISDPQRGAFAIGAPRKDAKGKDGKDGKEELAAGAAHRYLSGSCEDRP
jgi:primosomal replication protein N''